MKPVFLVTLLLCLLASDTFGQRTRLDSLLIYRDSLMSFTAVRDSIGRLIDTAGADTSESGILREYTRWSDQISNRICHDVPVGEDQIAPASISLSNFLRNKSSYCANSSNVFRGHWANIGPFIDAWYNSTPQRSGMVSRIWVKPGVSSNIIVGSYSGGLWETFNDGYTWTNITDAGSEVISGTIGIQSFDVDPLNSNIIYAATGQPNGLSEKSVGYSTGLIYTTNHGTTWAYDQALNTLIGNPNGLASEIIPKVAYMPGTEKLFLIYKDRIFLKASPSSAWQELSPGSTGYNFSDIEFSQQTPTSRTAIFSTVGTASSFPKLFMYSPSSTWTSFTIAAAGFSSIKNITVTSSDVILMNISAGLLVSTPMSSYTPTIVNSNFYLGFARPVNEIRVSLANSNVLYLAINSGGLPSFMVDVSGGAGTNVVDITGNAHADGRCIFIYSSSSNWANDVVLGGSDGGLVRKVNTSMQSNTGPSLCISQMFGLSNTDEDENIMMGGAQDNGDYTYMKNRTPQWRSGQWWGDEYLSAFTRNGVRTAYQALNFPGMFRMDFGSTNTTPSSIANPPSPPGLQWFQGNSKRPFYFDPGNQAYCGDYDFWSKSLANTTWTQLFSSFPKTSPAGKALAFILPEKAGYDNYAYIAYREVSGAVPTSSNAAGKLFKSVTVSRNSSYPWTVGSWVNITPGDVQWTRMNDIEIDPENPEHLFVALGDVNFGKVTADPADMAGRIKFSYDAGTHWQDISKGLPCLPINKLVYQKGTHYIYAGTDVGVFRCDFSTYNKDATLTTPDQVNPSVQWTCFNDLMPSLQVEDMEINYCAGKLRIATFGRGIWESDIMQEGATSPYSAAIGDFVPGATNVISSNTNWTSDRYLDASVIVKSPYTLHISNSTTTIHMPMNGYILVEAGASLIVDDATITNDCHAFWKGIITYGDNAKSQAGSNQAHVTLTNAHIENARVGVCNYAESVAGSNTAGAVIKCTTSTFLNCTRGAVFAPYRNYAGNMKLNDLSLFDRCTFEITNDYHGEKYGYNFSAHVVANGIYGIVFTGCDFLNNCTSSVCPNNVGLGVGIAKYSSSITVKAYCSGCTTYASYLASTTLTRSKFKGLQAGIVNWGDNQNNYLAVDHADFDKCSAGIYSSNQKNLNLFYNTFGIANAYYNFCNPSTSSTNCNQIGIVLIKDNQFRIEENTFTKAGTNTNGTGVYLEDVGVANQDVYRNSFTGLHNAFDARGKNAYWPIYPKPISATTGSQFLCNTDVNIDAVDLNANSIGFADQPAMRLIQGSASMPTGNTFAKTSPTSSGNGITWLEYSTTPTNIQYYWNASNESIVTTPTTYPAFWSIQTTSTKQCGTRQGSVKAFAADVRDLKASAQIRYNSGKADHLTAVSSLDALWNCGATEELLVFIDERSIEQAAEIHDQVNVCSPYVTEEIFRHLALNEKISEEMMIELLGNNPEICRNAEFIAFLANDIPTPYSEDAVEAIAELGRNVSARSTNEANILDSHHEMMLAGHDIIWSIMADSAGTDIDTLAKWYKEIPLLSNRYALASLYLEKVDTPKMWTALNDISTDFTLSSDETDEYNSYKDLYGILGRVKSVGRSELELDSTELADVDSIAIRGHGNASSTALSLYQQNLGLVPYVCINDPSLGLKPAPTKPIITKITDNKLLVYPNPAKDHVNFRYDEPVSKGMLNLAITNINGQQLFTKELKEKKGTFWWDTRQMPTGIYLYKITDGKKMLQSGKISIIK